MSRLAKGYIHVYTGNGKGKTTAAFGLALRAAMAGKKVYIGQFVKGMAYQETKCTAFIKGVTIEQYGTECFIDRKPDKEDINRAQTGLERCRHALCSGEYDVVIMDEVTIAVFYKLLTDQEIISALQEKLENVEVILTGRYASKKLIEAADLVSEIKEVKHYFNQGVLSRTGIDC
ncbi:MAG: cob(I)yrinic acid a,c-diamide adenosyltransferase [Clostridia bacterium]|nr:cob(I)yrinic acid a,c-diamide adenosyltransferase [Clostridia bacterium]